MIKIDTLKVGGLATNCYVVSKNGECVVIDPGGASETVKKNIGGKTLTAILLTHGHIDHIRGLADFSGVPIYIHTKDKEMLEDEGKNGSDRYRPPFTFTSADIVLLDENQRLNLAGMKIDVMHTPGHTLGGVCFKIGKNLFTGDLLFKNGYGRYDLYGGDEHTLFESLKKVLALKDVDAVYPGHGDYTTLERERGRYDL